MHSAVSSRAQAGRGHPRARTRCTVHRDEQLATALLCAVAALCLLGVGAKVWQRVAEARSIAALRGRLDAPASQIVLIVPADTPMPNAAAMPATPAPTPAPTQDAATADRLSNLRTLQSENSELFGWITIDDTRVDYPVMFSPDRPRYYLNRDFAGETSRCGLPFIDEFCRPYESRANLLLHGHNMKDGSMFAGLHKFEDADYYESHRTLTFYTPEQAEEYRIIAVATVKISEDSDCKYYLYTDIGSEAAFHTYMDLIWSHTVHARDTEAVWGDSLLTLSTCVRGDPSSRLIVVARHAG